MMLFQQVLSLNGNQMGETGILFIIRRLLDKNLPLRMLFILPNRCASFNTDVNSIVMEHATASSALKSVILKALRVQ